MLSCSQDRIMDAQEIFSEETMFAAMETNRQWPSYRGYFASGYLDNASLPDSFNLSKAGLNTNY